MNWFFKKHTPVQTEGMGNWEVLEAIDTDKLYNVLSDLKNDKMTYTSTKGWSEDYSHKIYPGGVFVVYGFLLFADKRIADLLDYKIFIDISDNLTINRRIRNDGEEHRYYIENIVVPFFNKEKQVQKERSDWVINGGIALGELTREVESKILGVTKGYRDYFSKTGPKLVEKTAPKHKKHHHKHKKHHQQNGLLPLNQ